MKSIASTNFAAASSSRVRLGLVLVGIFAGIFATLGAAGCKKTSGGNPAANGGSGGSAGTNGPDGGASDAPGADRADGPTRPACPAGAATGTKGKAETCSCDSECQTGSCANGVCCTSACTDNCKSCNLPSSLGDCAFVPAGGTPSSPTMCVAALPTTCGQDGTCDGQGGCRKYVRGTECHAGTCDGDGISGTLVCDGKGLCSPGAATLCIPYSCDPTINKCATACTTNAQCAAGQQCVNKSCGKKMNGSTCTGDDDCTSGHCTDGVCCNVSCAGACVSCNQTGSLGRCTFLEAGTIDAACKANDRTTCDTTGACDAFGSCALFPQNTPCGAATCSGDTLLNTTQTCDGQGTCRDPGLLDCAPFLCASGACNKVCLTDAECQPGHMCVPTPVNGMTTGLCGKKKNGQTCADPTECESSQCVDTVCCESACVGACRSCALPGSLGQCMNVAPGATDPRNTCMDTGKASCGTNGVCDGSGACQKYPTGTACANETCMLGAHTGTSTCNSAGQCVTPPSGTCNPYVCNAASCFTTCTTDAQCVPGKFCVNGSCGQKPPGADCSANVECQSLFCAQGVCCNNACTGACLACNLTTSLGLCTAVADGAPDPQGICAVTATTTCGTTGRCVSGGCAVVAKGTNCKPAVCATTSSATPVSTCDGAGTCATPTNQSCGTFVCAAGACKNTCATDVDCVPPNTCVNNSCGLKPTGAACSAGTQCASTLCTEGVCCNTACSDGATGGLCMSCKVTGKIGTCSPVGAGSSDIKGRCVASNAATGNCTNDGTCNGAGACRPWSTATGCRGASCTGSTFSPATNCDGKGVCPAATPQMCNPYTCNPASPSCLTTCTVDTQCTDALTCLKTNNQCGTKLPNGQACKANTDCTGGFCTAEGVCCNTACTGACQSCVISGKVGTCTSIAVGGTPRDATTCAASATNGCGNTTKCNGSGGCQLQSAGVLCGTPTCAPLVAGTVNGLAASESLAFIPAPTCNGLGTCVPSAAVSCQNFQCNATTNACKTSCTSTTVDCNALTPTATDPIGGNSCVGGTCQKKPNGNTCTSGFACVSGNCVDGICCGSAVCGTCLACNVANGAGALDGVCRAVAAGAPEPHGLCAVSSSTSCGTNGMCTGATAGVCQQWSGTACASVRITCADAHHSINIAGVCSGAGTCTPGTPVACAPAFLCSVVGGIGTCATTCTTANQATNCDTAAGFTCINGICNKMGAGGTCTVGTQCASGFCVDGVCCNSASCTDCSSCNVSGFAGTCHPVAAATPDGLCVAVCPVNGTSMSGLCDGAGNCKDSTPCNAGFACANGTGICATTCTGSGATSVGCATGFSCFNGACKKNTGQSCALGTECGTGNCPQGVCCNGACTGGCQTCTAATTGICTSIALGSPPRISGTCPNPTGGVCGNTGMCNGANGCQIPAAGAACNDLPSCTNIPTPTMTNGVRSCDGSGNCNPAAQIMCTPGFVCSGSSCATMCTPGTNAGCAPGLLCTSSGTCVTPKANGAICTSDGSDCASGLCVDGVCCLSTSCLPCQMCGAAGLCQSRSVGAVPVPGGGCLTTSPTSCGTDGLCDGNGACRFHGGNQFCGAASCTDDPDPTMDSTFILAGTGHCSGSSPGMCIQPAPTTCAGHLNCTGTACNAACTDVTQCVSGFVCAAPGDSSCMIPPPPPPTECTLVQDCSNPTVCTCPANTMCMIDLTGTVSMTCQ